MHFQGIKKRDFYQHFQTKQDCMHYLAEQKWKGGYQCRHCGHTTYIPGKQVASRRCAVCKYDESATAHTLFHKIKFCLLKAFELMFLISSQKKGMSTLSLSQELDLRYATCLAFRRKVQKSMESSENYPLKGKVEVDEFAVGGYDPDSQGRAKGDKKLVSVAIGVTCKGRFGRAYAVQIKNYSSKETGKIFEKHIDKQAEIRTDHWAGYLPLQKEWRHLNQEHSRKGSNFESLHLHIMNIKNWIRGIHHHVSEEYIQRYLDEMHFRLNRRNFRQAIFHKLVKRMTDSPPIFHEQLKVKAT